MKQTNFPPGWDDEHVERVLTLYEGQTEEDAVAEDEAAFDRDRLEVVVDNRPVSDQGTVRKP